MIRRKVGESMAFTGGTEPTPIVVVGEYRCPGSMNDGNKNFLIHQDVAGGRRSFELSLETMKAIIEWAEKDS